mgnify:CR=1 FL=1
MAETAVAVRELVAFCHRSGDIDQRFQASPTAADGQRGHREVAGRRPSGWEAEVALSHRWSDGDRTLLLRGRPVVIGALLSGLRIVVVGTMLPHGPVAAAAIIDAARHPPRRRTADARARRRCACIAPTRSQTRSH